MCRLVTVFVWSAIAFGAADAPPPATLSFAGHPLFVFRARVGSIAPSERVRLISDRIDRLANDHLFNLATLTARDGGDIGWQIFAGDSLLLAITPEDAKVEGQPARLIAEGIAFRLRELLEQDRHSRTPKELLIRSLYAFAELLALFLALWGLRRLYRRGATALEDKQGSLVRALRIKDLEIVPAERIALLSLSCLKLLRFLLTVTLLYFFVPLVLSLFPWTARLSPILLGYVLSPLEQMWSGFVGFLPNLFFIALNVFIARYSLKFIRLIFYAIEKQTVRFAGFYPEWAQPTYQLVRALVVAFTAIMVFPYIPGSSSPAFQGVSVFLGVLVSLGSTSAVANVVSGIVLTYMRSFRPGDRVKIADTTGDIVEKTLLVTRVRTVKNVDITIPNSMVLGNHIINYSTLAPTEGLILHTEVTIGYDVPWRQVHGLLLDAARATAGILSSPEPFVLQTSLDDSYVRYQLNAYTRQANGMASLYSALHENIQDCFNAAQVEILSPSYKAVRDGNTTTIPPQNRSTDYRAPSFRLSKTDPE